MVLQPVGDIAVMSEMKRNNLVIENGQERDLADSRYLDDDRAEREREIRKLAKDRL